MDVEAGLRDLERRLDPSAPERTPGVEILGYGEVSAVLGWDGVPGRVLKRMSGFRTRAEVEAYAAVVDRYVALLRDLDVPVVDTEVALVSPEPSRHVAYLLQPRLEPERLGHSLLRTRPVEEIFPLLDRVLGLVRRVLDANTSRTDAREVAIDAQLSNWHWPDQADTPRPVLLDVGTPFLRRAGALETGTDLYLCAYPGPVRWWLRRDHAVEKYIADYFHFDRTVLDLLGNFIKERAADKLPAAVDFVNRWIAGQPEGERLGSVDEERARAYYSRDAASLELSLRARRAARFVRRSLLRRRYDFILPGPIER
jgi:hypothetical protein